MNKNMKILGVLLALAITGLSVENALTGHGIKGNKNLNPEILASGSSGSGTNSTGTGTGTSSAGECTSSWPGDCIQTGNKIYQVFYEKGNLYVSNMRPHPTNPKITCYDYLQEYLPGKCVPGSEECTPGLEKLPTTYSNCP